MFLLLYMVALIKGTAGVFMYLDIEKIFDTVEWLQLNHILLKGDLYIHLDWRESIPLVSVEFGLRQVLVFRPVLFFLFINYIIRCSCLEAEVLIILKTTHQGSFRMTNDTI